MFNDIGTRQSPDSSSLTDGERERQKEGKTCFHQALPEGKLYEDRGFVLFCLVTDVSQAPRAMPPTQKTPTKNLLNK